MKELYNWHKVLPGTFIPDNPDEQPFHISDGGYLIRDIDAPATTKAEFFAQLVYFLGRWTNYFPLQPK